MEPTLTPTLGYGVRRFKKNVIGWLKVYEGANDS